MSLLSLKNVNVTYKVKEQKIYAVNDVSFDVEEQDSVGIVGESGSGKSTLAMAVLRLHNDMVTNISGNIIFEGKDLVNLNNKELKDLRWIKMAAVFQKSMNSLSPVHRIGSQLTDIYRVHRPNTSKSEAKERIMELFKLVNLPERAFNSYQHELSGGMTQRISIALSLMFNPKLIIMDEATTALDVVTESQILSEIMQLEKDLKVTRMMITHDISIVANTCNKIAVMYAGHLLEFGLVKDVIPNPKHPYTRGLLKSFPNFKGEKVELKSLQGRIPDMSIKSDRCIFYDRCTEKSDICKSNKPVLTKIDNLRSVSCHLVRM